MAFISMIFAMAAVIAAFSLICYIICAIGNWKVFTKAGEEGWKAIIPIYNNYVSYKISWNTKMFWIMLGCLVINFLCSKIGGFVGTLGGLFSLAATILTFIQCTKLAKAFGHGIGFAIGLFFLNPIFVILLGFDSSSYLGPQE